MEQWSKNFDRELGRLTVERLVARCIHSKYTCREGRRSPDQEMRDVIGRG